MILCKEVNRTRRRFAYLMSRRLLASIVVLFISIGVAVGLIVPLSGPATRVSGYTKNDDGQIVPYVSVHLYHEATGTHWYTTSWSTGYYKFNVGDKIGWFKIEGSKNPNYLPKVQRFYRPDEYEGVVIDVITWKDSDQDGISDDGPQGDTFNEDYIGTNPNDPNTDNDGYSDYYDPSPLWRTGVQGSWTIQEHYCDVLNEWHDMYQHRPARADVKYNSNSKIVAFKNLKTEASYVDPICGAYMEWQESASCSKAGWADSKGPTYVGLGSIKTHNWAGEHSLPETTTLRFLFSNTCDGWTWDNQTGWHVNPEMDNIGLQYYWDVPA